MRTHFHRIAVVVTALTTVNFAAFAQNDGAPPFAFAIEPVTFSNGPVQLSGGLLKPEGAGPFPAIVLVHGAGRGTFNEPAFRVHANAFVRTGFAVLVYDKRGSGKSAGDLDTADYDDLTSDLAAAVRLLRARRDIVADRIGLLGRSEGAWVGMLAASRDRAIAFLILSSGSAVRPSEQMKYWTRGVMRAHGASDQEVADSVHAREALSSYYRHVVKDGDWARSPVGLAERESVQKQLQQFAHFAPELAPHVADPTQKSAAYFKALVQMNDFDPAPALQTMRTPLLEIIGATDDVVEPASTVAALERLRQAGRDVTVRTLPQVGHTLLITTPKGPRYPDDYPEFAARWARERVDGLPHKP